MELDLCDVLSISLLECCEFKKTCMFNSLKLGGMIGKALSTKLTAYCYTSHIVNYKLGISWNVCCSCVGRRYNKSTGENCLQENSWKHQLVSPHVIDTVN